MAKDFSLLVKIRLNFWEEYERAARAQERMDPFKLFRGVCRHELYYKLYEKYPALFAWVVCPLAGYLLQRKELEFMAEERMVEILSVSPIKEDGRMDSRWAKIQVELYELLQNRIYGAVTQKIESEQKNLNVNLNSNQTSEEAARTISVITNVEELDRRIKVIQERRKALQTVPQQPVELDTELLMRPDGRTAETQK